MPGKKVLIVGDEAIRKYFIQKALSGEIEIKKDPAEDGPEVSLIHFFRCFPNGATSPSCRLGQSPRVVFDSITKHE